MRRQRLASANLAVFIETNPFREQDPQYHASRAVTLPVATASTAKLIAAAQRALEGLWRPGYRYKKAGVMLLGALLSLGLEPVSHAPTRPPGPG